MITREIKKSTLISYACMLFLIVLPFETYSFITFEMTKAVKIFFMLLISMLILVSIYKEKMSIDYISIFFIFFQLSTLLIINFNENPEGSFTKWIQYLVITIMYVSLIQLNLEKLKSSITIILSALLVISVTLMVFQLKFNEFWPNSVLNTATGIKRAVAFFNNANGLGGFLVTSTLFVIWKTLITKSKIYFCVSIIGIFGLYLSDSEGSILAFLVGLIFLVSMKSKKILFLFRYILVSSVSIFIILTLFSSSFQSWITFKLQSQARYNLWKAAVEIFKDNWLFGIGNYSFSEEVKNYGVISQYGSTYPHPHNFILDFIVCYGLLGLIIISIVIGFLFLLTMGKLKFVQNNNYFLNVALLSQGFVHDLVDGGYLIGTSSVVIFQLLLISIFKLKRSYRNEKVLKKSYIESSKQVIN